MKLNNLYPGVHKLGPAVATAALMAAGSANVAAAPVSTELAFTCPFPLIGDQPIRATISADIPATVNAGDTLPAFAVSAITVVNDDARTGLKLVQSKTLEGTATNVNRIITAAGRSIEQVVHLDIPATNIPEESGEFNVPAAGSTTEVLFTSDDVGQAEIRIGELTLDLVARTANGDIAPAPIGEITTSCTQLPNQDNLLVTLTVAGEQVETPRISINTEELAFGSVQAGLNAQQSVSVISTGSAALGINNISISGPDAHLFTQTNNCGAALSPETSCAVNVTFAPSTDGTRSATLTIESTDADKPSIDVALSGRGTLAPSPEISVTPGSVNLGRVQVGMSKSEQVTITNTGNAALQIDSITLTGTHSNDFTQTNQCTTIAAGSSCSVDVNFVAAAVGVSNAALVVRSSDTENAEVTIPVTAEAFEEPTGGAELELLLGLEGSTLIAGTGGTLPLTGSIATMLDLASGTFEADTQVLPTSGNFSIKVLWSKINAAANVEFEQAGLTTGALVNGKLTANSPLYVKVPKVAIKVFGLPVRVGGGHECRTSEPVNIQLTTPEGSNFSPATGGDVAGVYDLPPLQNCGLLTGLLNKFMSGPGNTINLNLTPQ
ncbi:choice-of-anchor D domain-containing protein [Marinobacter sp.]|uniref:choice-of-anchor D domain-containing protein n=1 Tax=Marinobacter sp. TaxID=50741 RepID=UPI00356B33D2